MLTSGYELAFFDNLNRFYVAEEHRGLTSRFPAEPAAWDKVAHLWDQGRAASAPQHGDHALARIIEHGVMALLPSLPAALLAQIIESGLTATRTPPFGSPEATAALRGVTEHPGPEAAAADLGALIESDRFRAALGRIACAYDGGHIMD